MFPGRGGERWKAAVAAIYDIPRLQGEFEEIMARELSGDAAAIAEMQAFFGSEPGQRILKLEIDARYALLDEATEEAARVAWDKAVGARDPRVKLIRKLAEANELIEMNVAGAMTGNLAFFQGMNESGTLGPAMNEQDIMADVWGQEEQIRRDTEAWLYPFLLLAYTPLSDSEMEAYVAFSETAAGQRLNAALFAGFDVVFRGISHDLGRAAGLALQGSDI
ncbi:MAG: DUF2059 domain-containing protein [Tabrizicola sp.]|nr:DUF2059 domain-containing protein [Tabrizicola sp.]